MSPTETSILIVGIIVVLGGGAYIIQMIENQRRHRTVTHPLLQRPDSQRHGNL